MDIGSKLLFFFSALGAFNGLVLGIYFIFFTAKKNLSNYFLGGLLMALSIRIGKSVILIFASSTPRTVLQIGLTACAFIGPCLYFFLQSELKQPRQLPRTWLLQLAASAIIVVGVGLLYPYERFPLLWGQRIIPLIYLQWGVYLAFSIAALLPLLKKKLRKDPWKMFEKWILTICSVVLIIYTSYVWAYLNITRGSYIVSPLYFSLILYLLVFFLLYRKKASDLSSFGSLKSSPRMLSEGDAQVLLSKLTKVMTEKEIFKDPNLKMSDVAKAIHIPSHQLSQLLNTHLSKNFTLFVNEYRIAEACRMLAEDQHLTIDAISFEAGFNSKSTFFATFKKMKGLTPSAFQQSVIPDL